MYLDAQEIRKALLVSGTDVWRAGSGTISGLIAGAKYTKFPFKRLAFTTSDRSCRERFTHKEAEALNIIMPQQTLKIQYGCTCIL